MSPLPAVLRVLVPGMDPQGILRTLTVIHPVMDFYPDQAGGVMRRLKELPFRLQGFLIQEQPGTLKNCGDFALYPKQEFYFS